MWTKVMAILGAVIVLGGISAGILTIEDRYAKADDLKQEKTRLSVHVIQDQIRFLQNQMWGIMDRCQVKQPYELSGDAKAHYREYESQKKVLEVQLSSIMKSKY